MGALTVALNDRLRWTVPASHADIVAQIVFAAMLDQSAALVHADEFLTAARAALQIQPSRELAAIVAAIEAEEDLDSLMVFIERPRI